MSLIVREARDGVTFEVRVAPRASRSKLNGVSDGALKISLTAPPVEGAANAALCELLSEVLGVPRRAVEIRQGERGKRKVVWIGALTRQALLDRVNAALG